MSKNCNKDVENIKILIELKYFDTNNFRVIRHKSILQFIQNIQRSQY
jgi:hypothetical protein